MHGQKLTWPPEWPPKPVRFVRINSVTWSPVTESNRRPSPYHGDALPTELTGRVFSCPTWAAGADHRRGGSGPIPRTGLGELTVLRRSWRTHLGASRERVRSTCRPGRYARSTA